MDTSSPFSNTAVTVKGGAQQHKPTKARFFMMPEKHHPTTQSQFGERDNIRFDSDYSAAFPRVAVEWHLNELCTLDDKECCRLFREKNETLPYETLTVFALRYAGLFPVIVGLIELYGFDISAIRLYTFEKKENNQQAHGDTPAPGTLSHDAVVGHFTVSLDPQKKIDDDTIRPLSDELQQLIHALAGRQHLQVRNHMAQRMGAYLSSLPKSQAHTLFPLDIDFDTAGTSTTCNVTGEDTPGFLFALANALTLRNMVIHKVAVHRTGVRVKGLFYIRTKQNKPITDKTDLEKLRFAVVIIKQFTHLLPFAPDPYLALKQFDQFVDELIEGQFLLVDVSKVNDYVALSSLAKIFGVGRYFWEEFIRMQYAAFTPFLIPFIEKTHSERVRKDAAQFTDELHTILEGNGDRERKVALINAYKNKELFRADLFHLMDDNKTFDEFSSELCDLAEVVIRQTADVIYKELVVRYGKPRTDTGAVCGYAVCGLGKFGSREMGYASDIELVLVYEENGFTDNEKKMRTNAEFFSSFVIKLTEYIWAKKEGIFEIDLRLRPDGNKGELAASLRRWREYYAPGGKAYDFERQALIKMRPICGDSRLCRMIIDERDAIVFGETAVPIQRTLKLRTQQIAALVKPDEVNAKYSAGGLVDVEYATQFLQLEHGRLYGNLRRGNTLAALDALLQNALISPHEFEILYTGYVFLRRLINALRIVRGNAKDLTVPHRETNEFVFLTKRLGYTDHAGRAAADELYRDIEETFARTRHFFQQRFENERTPAGTAESFVDIVIQENGDDDMVRNVLKTMNFTHIERAVGKIKEIRAIRAENRNMIYALLGVALRAITQATQPDTALGNFCDYLAAVRYSPVTLRRFLFRPQSLEMLIALSSVCYRFSGLFIHNPEYIFDLSKPEQIFFNKMKTHYCAEVNRLKETVTDREWPMVLSAYFQQELIRIVARMVYTQITRGRLMRELAELVETVVVEWYDHLINEYAMADPHIVTKHALVATGSLATYEFQYNGCISLVCVVTDTALETAFAGIACQLKERLESEALLGSYCRLHISVQVASAAAGGNDTEVLSALANAAKTRALSGNADLAERFCEKLTAQVALWVCEDEIGKSLREEIRCISDMPEESPVDDTTIVRILTLVDVMVCRLQYGANKQTVHVPQTLMALNNLYEAKIMNEKAHDVCKRMYLELTHCLLCRTLIGTPKQHERTEAAQMARNVAYLAGYNDTGQEDAERHLYHTMRALINDTVMHIKTFV